MMSGPIRILVTGREGQVVRSLLDRGQHHPDLEIVPLGRPEFDLAETGRIMSGIEAARPDVIVSAAAYTAVDLAETDVEMAERINALAPGVIGEAAQALGVPVVHLSTDYVFDGQKASPYEETDPVSPLGVYGRTKLVGERLLADATSNHAILRTAWVYSPFGKNFVKTMLRLGAERNQVRVVADQVGNPTSALDIADGVIRVARNLLADREPSLRGVFHMTARGEASWASFAVDLFLASRKSGGPWAAVEPILSRDYPTPAQRPMNSRLDCEKLAAIHGVRLPEWRESLSEVVKAL